MPNTRTLAAAAFTLAVALLAVAGALIFHRAPTDTTVPASPVSVSQVTVDRPAAPWWCVDGPDETAFRAEVDERMHRIRIGSPGLEVDPVTVEVTMLAECPLPPGLRPVPAEVLR